MGNRLGWIVFAGTIATVLGGYLVFTMWPHPRETYCTAGFGSCITNRRGEFWIRRVPPVNHHGLPLSRHTVVTRSGRQVFLYGSVSALSSV